MVLKTTILDGRPAGRLGEMGIKASTAQSVWLELGLGLSLAIHEGCKTGNVIVHNMYRIVRTPSKDDINIL